jgi:hypothetical protein
MIARQEGPASPELLESRRQLTGATRPLVRWTLDPFTVCAYACGPSVWFVAGSPDEQSIALRGAHAPIGDLTTSHVAAEKTSLQVEAASQLGAFRIAASASARDGALSLHVRTSFLPSHDLRMPPTPRDVFGLDGANTSPQHGARLYTMQHGFQTGSLFAACAGLRGYSLFYLQNFTSLRKYFEHTHTTPKDAVGGSWPEIGFRLPGSETHPLLASNDYTISDAYLVLRSPSPDNEGQAAVHYLDALASIVRQLDTPPTTYHDWPHRATQTVYDLSQSPECTVAIDRHRYLAPYVNMKNKPPESMVQLTVLVALAEFERWSGATFDLTADLLHGLPTFFDEDVGSIVRWLPGQRFGSREDEHQGHDSMDSWYLYHVLFNVARLARAGSPTARTILQRSLPYAIRVAKRFAYRWPIFFNLKTLDVIQAEAHRGSGGENDVSGLYALLMLLAFEVFEDDALLEEAKTATDAMQGFGFALSYQANTTGFAGEAALRLWKITGEQRYFDLAMVAIANVFDNMSMWDAGYGNARYFSTYFGLYPLRGAPYIAAYEEVELLAKTHEFLRLGGDDLPPSVILLGSEFAKWLISRGWQYYPGELPEAAIAEKARNGVVRRELSVPLEDLHEGGEQSGQVGQEIYGSGLALVCATRHYKRLDNRPYVLFSEYPLQSLSGTRFRIVGDPHMRCQVRLIPVGPNAVVAENELSIAGSKRRASRCVEGHILLEANGNDVLVLRSRKTPRRAK